MCDGINKNGTADDTCVMDIAGGTVVKANANITGDVATWAGDGRMTAYGGDPDYKVQATYDGSKTTIQAALASRDITRLSAPPAGTLIDYDPGFRNGGFELPVGSTDRNWWTGFAVNECLPADDADSPEGARELRARTFGDHGAVQNTGHRVTIRDKFTLASFLQNPPAREWPVQQF